MAQLISFCHRFSQFEGWLEDTLAQSLSCLCHAYPCLTLMTETECKYHLSQVASYLQLWVSSFLLQYGYRNYNGVLSG